MRSSSSLEVVISGRRFLFTKKVAGIEIWQVLNREDSGMPVPDIQMEMPRYKNEIALLSTNAYQSPLLSRSSL